jgi:hypothetical protein
MHLGLAFEFSTSFDTKNDDVDTAAKGTLTIEDSSRIADVEKIVLECLGKTPNIVLTHCKSNSYVSCIPGKVILWDQNIFRNEKLPTVVFWTIFEQLNIQSYLRVDEIISKFENNELTLDNAVTEIERLEHDNSLKAQAIMITAIASQKLAFTTENLPKIPKDFSLHYRIQQLESHSLRIAKRVLQRCSSSEKSHSYTGTWKIKLDAISEMQKKVLGGLLQLKHEMENEAQHDKAVLKLGCNLLLDASRHSEGNSTSFLQEAAQEIFTPSDISLAQAKAKGYLSRAT